VKYNKYIRKIKVLFRGSVSALLFNVLHRKGFDISNVLIICGSTRSGSTWLAEIVSSLPGLSQVFEPLNIQYVKQAKEAGIVKNTFKKHDEKWEQGLYLFRRILSGKLINPWVASQIPINKVYSTQRLVVKFVRANMLLGWITENFTILPPALVIRHPCAYVCSQIQKGWNPSLNVMLSNKYFDDHPAIRDQCLCLSTPEELNALAWCMRYHAPLSLKKPHPFILICYEKLVNEPVQEVGKLFDAWGLDMTDEVINQLNKPSNTVTKSSQIVTGKDPLSGWKSRLSQKQINNVMSVLAIFDMNFYNEELEADYEILYNFPDD
jgi:hypothetical protein